MYNDIEECEGVDELLFLYWSEINVFLKSLSGVKFTLLHFMQFIYYYLNSVWIVFIVYIIYIYIYFPLE